MLIKGKDIVDNYVKNSAISEEDDVTISANNTVGLSCPSGDVAVNANGFLYNGDEVAVKGDLDSLGSTYVLKGTNANALTVTAGTVLTASGSTGTNLGRSSLTSDTNIYGCYVKVGNAGTTRNVTLSVGEPVSGYIAINSSSGISLKSTYYTMEIGDRCSVNYESIGERFTTTALGVKFVSALSEDRFNVALSSSGIDVNANAISTKSTGNITIDNFDSSSPNNLNITSNTMTLTAYTSLVLGGLPDTTADDVKYLYVSKDGYAVSRMSIDELKKLLGL